MSLSEDVVIIKPKAYQKMLLHVLRFGSMSLEKKIWKEIMGLCVGKIENDQVIIYDALPMTHGKKVEVEFSETDYANVETFQTDLAEKCFFIVGWYHSHPGMGPFLSEVDKKNHFYWQNVNAKAVAIVWDHTLLEEGLGFEVFRLNDMSLGVQSDFHAVKFEVQPPDSMDFFKDLVQLVEDVQKGDPILKEEGEMVDFFEGMAISSAKSPEGGDLNAYVVNNATMILQTIRDLKQSMTTGLNRLQNWFKDALSTGISEPIGNLEYEFWNLSEKLKNALNLRKEEKSEESKPT